MKMKDQSYPTINEKRPDGLNDFGSPYRVLVVDDSGAMRKIVGRALKSEAFDVCGEAAGGAEALEQYKVLSPDAVTMDINMPGMNGIESLKKLMAYDKDAKVVMLTTEGQKETVAMAINEGAEGFVVKPPQKEAICSKVRKAIRG